MDRLKKLLDAHPVSKKSDKKNEQGYSREAERLFLNTADARANKQVYQNEIKQASLYEQSQMPPSPADVGVSFKIGSFVNKLSQLLGFKTDIYGQLQTLINLGNSPARLLSDARLISISSDYFKMVDIIATYNELVNYIKLYAPQMTQSSDFSSGVNTTYLLPLISLLKQTASLYATSFNNFPTTNLRNTGPERAAYERFRTGAADAYSTVKLMEDNLKAAIYTNITKKDVARYKSSAENERIKNEIFNQNPLPVAPAVDPLVQQQQAADAAAAAAAAAAAQGGPGPAPQQGQAPDAGPPQPGNPQSGPFPWPAIPPPQAPDGGYGNYKDRDGIMALLRAYNDHQVANGVRVDAVFNTRRLAGEASGLKRDIITFAVAGQPGLNTPSSTIVGKYLPDIRREYIEAARAAAQAAAAQAAAQQAQQGQAAGPADPQQQQQQQQQQQPAAPAARQLTAEQQAYLDAGGTQPLQIAELNRDQTDEVWELYKAYEIDTLGAVLDPGTAQNPNIQGMRAFYDTLPQNLRNLMQKIGTGDDIDEDTAVLDSLRDWIVNIKQQRQTWGNAQQPQRQPSNSLIGLGRGERRANARANARQYLHRQGVPPELLAKLMKHYGITDDTLVGELEGSGIWDTVKDWASSAADSASGWYNTIANNLPTMSDVRRATSRIIPDSLSDYVPSGLQRTWGDKAKDFFGFGSQRGHLEDMKLLAELERGHPRTVDMSQGREAREKMMPFINELNAPAEFLKRRGQILSGGVYDGVHENINDQLPYEIWGGNAALDNEEEMTPFKRRIGLANPFAYQSRADMLPIRPALASNATDIDETLQPFQEMFSTTRGGFEKEKEKPKDMDEDPDPIRITNENWKVFTGRMAKPKYKISS